MKRDGRIYESQRWREKTRNCARVEKRTHTLFRVSGRTVALPSDSVDSLSDSVWNRKEGSQFRRRRNDDETESGAVRRTIPRSSKERKEKKKKRRRRGRTNEGTEGAWDRIGERKERLIDSAYEGVRQRSAVAPLSFLFSQNEEKKKQKKCKKKYIITNEHMMFRETCN